MSRSSAPPPSRPSVDDARRSERQPSSVRGIRVSGSTRVPSGAAPFGGAVRIGVPAADERFRRALSFFGPLAVLIPFLAIGIAVFGVAPPPTNTMPLGGALLRASLGAFAAVALAAPPALAASAFVTVLGPRILRGPMARLVALSSSIPTVVIGAFGYFLVAPIVPRFFGTDRATTTAITAIFVLAMAVAPTIANVARRLARAVPGDRVEAALALGATRRQVAVRLLLPAIGRGIYGALLIAVGRAAGEASAILLLMTAVDGSEGSSLVVDAARAVLAGGAALGDLPRLIGPLLGVTFVAQIAGRALVEGTKRRLAGGQVRPLASPWSARP